MPEKPFASTLMRKARSILVEYIIMYHLFLSAPRVLGAESSPDSSSVAADQVGLQMQIKLNWNKKSSFSPEAPTICPFQWRCEQTCQSQWWYRKPPAGKGKDWQFQSEAMVFLGEEWAVGAPCFRISPCSPSRCCQSALGFASPEKKWKWIGIITDLYKKWTFFSPSPLNPLWERSWTCLYPAGPDHPSTRIHLLIIISKMPRLLVQEMTLIFIIL